MSFPQAGQALEEWCQCQCQHHDREEHRTRAAASDTSSSDARMDMDTTYMYVRYIDGRVCVHKDIRHIQSRSTQIGIAVEEDGSSDVVERS